MTTRSKPINQIGKKVMCYSTITELQNVIRTSNSIRHTHSNEQYHLPLTVSLTAFSNIKASTSFPFLYL